LSVGVEALFTSALGLQPPWVVEDVLLDVASKRIDFEVRCDGTLLSCPACGAASQPVHDRLRRKWRHLDFFQFEAWLHADVPRVACGGCGKTTQLGVPWARPGSGFTAAFEALALALCRELPVRQAGALLRCSDKQLWRRIEFYVDQARASESFEGVQIVGIDETSVRRGQHYITVVHDLHAKRLLFAAEGRDHQTVVDFAADLKAHGGDPAEVRHVCMDMSAAYAKGATLALPQADISYDRFHVVAMAIQAMDDVRREELRAEPAQVAAALQGADPETRRNLLWGMRKNPGGLDRGTDRRDVLVAALGAQERAGVAAAHGAARGLCARQATQQRRAGGQRSESLDKLGQTLPPGAVQEAGHDDQGALRRRRARHARSPQQRLRRVDERAAPAGQARCARIPHGQELHRHRIPAPVTPEEPPGSSVQPGRGGQLNPSRSTRNGIEPLPATGSASYSSAMRSSRRLAVPVHSAAGDHLASPYRA
jgi:transposase